MIADLIDSFDLDPVTTCQKLRELPELRDPFIGDLFSLVIFQCDDLLAMRPESALASPSVIFPSAAARFFQIALRLPKGLQMMLCNRVFGAVKDTVLMKNSEPAFKRLGRLLTTESEQEYAAASKKGKGKRREAGSIVGGTGGQ